MFLGNGFDAEWECIQGFSHWIVIYISSVLNGL